MGNVLSLRLKKFLKGEYVMVLIMLGMGVLLTFIFGQAFSGSYTPRAMVLDLDGSALSGELVTALEDSNQFEIVLAGSREEAEHQVEEGWAFMALVIPEGFSDGGEELTIIKTHDVMESWAFTQQVRKHADQLMGDRAFAKILSEVITDAGGNVSSDVIKASLKEARANPMAVVEYTEDEGSDNVALLHYLLGYMIFFSTFTVVFVAANILEDRQNGVWDRLMVSPTRRTSVLSGYLVFAFLTGALQVLLMVLAGQYFFGVQWGEHVGFAILLLTLFVLVMTSFGLFMAASSKNMSQLSAAVPVILVSSAMLGGCMWPLDMITFKPLIYLARVTPHMWALKGLEDLVIRGMVPSELWLPVVVLSSMVVFWFFLGLWRFNSNYK